VTNVQSTETNNPNIARQFITAAVLTATCGSAVVIDYNTEGWTSDIYTAAAIVYAIGAVSAWQYLFSYCSEDNWVGSRYVGKPTITFLGLFRIPKYVEVFTTFLAGIGWAVYGYLLTHQSGPLFIGGVILLVAGLIAALASWQDARDYARYAKNWRPRGRDSNDDDDLSSRRKPPSGPSLAA